MVAAAVAAVVTASFPFYIYGAWLIIDEETVTWRVLRRHLRYVGFGLLLNTVPVVTWMLPRVFDQLSGAAALHAILGVQAYAMLTFALSGIVHIFRVKWRHDLYHDPDPDVALSDLHEDMPHWRRRLRVGVAGYVVFWVFAWIVGLARFVSRYALL